LGSTLAASKRQNGMSCLALAVFAKSSSSVKKKNAEKHKKLNLNQRSAVRSANTCIIVHSCGTQ